MLIGTRNHLASLCYQYTKRQHPEDYEILKKLAEENYVPGLGPISTIPAVLKQFSRKKLASETTDVI